MTTPPAPPAPPAALDTPARILVVDDQPANVQVLGSTLGREGHEIVPASDGPTALKRLALRLPDLVLLDVLMPGMDGVEVCRRIRENPVWQDIPIIFLSAADDKEVIVRALQAGGMDYVTKPFNQAELLSRVRTHLELKAARDRLRQLAEDKDELLGIIAHDLKNSLGSIQMTAGFLRDRLENPEDPKMSRLCENLVEGCAQLLSFVNSLLANAMAEHRLQLESERVDVRDIVKRVLRNYEVAARRKQLELRVELPDTAAAVLTDGRALEQVIDNLVSNAVKFSPPVRAITVGVVVTDEDVLCRVRDQGPGLTEADKKRLFHRFGRLSPRPTGGEPSIGLGLSIVKKLIESMGGEVRCDSAPGEGSTFSVELPRVVPAD